MAQLRSSWPHVGPSGRVWERPGVPGSAQSVWECPGVSQIAFLLVFHGFFLGFGASNINLSEQGTGSAFEGIDSGRK